MSRVSLRTEIRLHEGVLGDQPDTIIDPAEVDDRVMCACEAFGYECATMYTFTEGKIVNRFALPRLSLPAKLSRYSLDAKLSGFESAIKSILGRS